jgi:hypothetical protein
VKPRQAPIEAHPGGLFGNAARRRVNEQTTAAPRLEQLHNEPTRQPVDHSGAEATKADAAFSSWLAPWDRGVEVPGLSQSRDGADAPGPSLLPPQAGRSSSLLVEQSAWAKRRRAAARCREPRRRYARKAIAGVRRQRRPIPLPTETLCRLPVVVQRSSAAHRREERIHARRSCRPRTVRAAVAACRLGGNTGRLSVTDTNRRTPRGLRQSRSVSSARFERIWWAAATPVWHAVSTYVVPR